MGNKELNHEKSEFTLKNILLFAFAVICAFLCGVEVGSIAAIFPEITADLNTDIVTAGWILSIYSLVTYPSMIMMGRIADLIGMKQAVIASCALFLLGAIGVVFTSSVGLILFFRAIMGIGAGGLSTSSMSLVAVAFPRNRHRMMGLAVNAHPLATILGSNIGVFVTLITGSWRNLFWMYVIAMAIAIAVFSICMPDVRRRRHGYHRGHGAYKAKLRDNHGQYEQHGRYDEDKITSLRDLDFLGAFFMCAAVCFLMLSITEFKNLGVNMTSSHWMQIAVYFVLFLVTAALFVVRVCKAKHPIIDREVLFNRKFSSVTAFFFIYGFVCLGMAQMVPTFCQRVFGFSSTMSATVVMFKGIGWFLCGLIVGAFIKKFGYRIPLIVCISIIGGIYLIFGLISKDNFYAAPVSSVDYLGYWWIFVLSLVLGVGVGLASPTMSNIAVDLMPDNIGMIYGVTNAFRQIGSTLCVPIVTVIISVFGDASGLGFRVVYLVMTALTLICLFFIFQMPKAPTTAHPFRKTLH